MFVALKLNVIHNVSPLSEDFENPQPEMLLPKSFFVLSFFLFSFFVYLKRCIFQAFSISENEHPMSSSRQRHTNSIARFQESDLILVIAPYQTQNNNIVLLALIIVNSLDFDLPDWRIKLWEAFHNSIFYFEKLTRIKRQYCDLLRLVILLQKVHHVSQYHLRLFRIRL
jgi:hypothetical protein